MDRHEKEYWFPVKRYGWGWGPPTTWQGWLVLAIYMVTIVLVVYFLPPDRHPVLFIAGMMISTALLVQICWLKGEPPRWRWGGTDYE